MTGRSPDARLAAVPSVDRVLGLPAVAAFVRRHGRPLALEAARAELQAVRERLQAGELLPDDGALAGAVAARAERLAAPSLRPVCNLTGTVLHTNLGRALLPEEAIAAMAAAARAPANLEYEVEDGRRGERDDHLEGWLRRLTGAEAATVVNNNAAALLLVLNTLALGREVPVSRGELIEIGGAFRLPEIMRRAGCRLVEVGTTNRTHLKDYAGTIGAETGLLLKVHTSNYAVQGFTAAVPEARLAALAHERGLALAIDLGAGTLVDLTRFGLPHEPTPMEALQAGADLVTFSGDKLLGGPQAGIVVGRRDLVEQLRRNPLKRALRLDKVTTAALGAVLRLYGDPERLVERLPTLRLLARPAAEIARLAERIAPALAARLGDGWEVASVPCRSQIGSGALPVELLESRAVAMRPAGRSGGRVERLAAAFRALPLPTIGRIADGALLFDLRCLEDADGFLAQLDRLVAP